MKTKSLKFCIVLSVVVITLLFFVFTRDDTTKKAAETPIPEQATSTEPSSLEEKTYAKRDYKKEFDCAYEESNVGHTECTFEKLDRASAIREWKQRKLEALKDPEISIVNFMQDLPGSVDKIKKWREGFENSRNAGCIAEHSSFRNGSGTPGAIAGCELVYETLALKALDTMYYRDILEIISRSEGILDFEPTEKDIENIAGNNKTKRGCVWAGEDNCD